MSTEGNPRESFVHLPYYRQVIGQIRFDPSDELKEHLVDLYEPQKRELGSRGIYLTSQYKLVAEQAPGGVIKGIEGQKAEHLRKALDRSVSSTKHLAGYLRFATAVRDDRELFALQFAVHLDKAVINAIDRDELLHKEPLLSPRSTSLKAVIVYDTQSMLEANQRDRALRSLAKFVIGQDMASANGGDDRIISPNDKAIVSNLRVAFSQTYK